MDQFKIIEYTFILFVFILAILVAIQLYIVYGLSPLPFTPLDNNVDSSAASISSSPINIIGYDRNGHKIENQSSNSDDIGDLF